MTLSTFDMAVAAANEPRGHFILRNEFTGQEVNIPLKDLPYRDYLAFCNLAAPVFETLVGGVEPVLQNTTKVELPGGAEATAVDNADAIEMVARIGAEGLDFKRLLELSGDELPKLAHLVVKQGHPAMSMDEMLHFARRPHVLLDLVLAQMEVNNIVKEFADFFPRLASRFGNIMGALSEKKTEATE